MPDGPIGDVTGILDDPDARKARAAAWFRELRNMICSRFEGLEDALESGPSCTSARRALCI